METTPDFRQATVMERRWNESVMPMQTEQLEQLRARLEEGFSSSSLPSPEQQRQQLLKERQASETETTVSSLVDERDHLILHHDRPEEAKRLREWYQKQQHNEQDQEVKVSFPLLLVTGPSGSGRTKLIEYSLDTDCILKGSFDFLKRAQPYEAFASTVSGFAANLPEDRRLAARACILKHVGGHKNSRVLMNIFPSLQTILGDDVTEENGDKVTEEDDEDVQRFVFVFRRFMQAIGTRDHPVVLLLRNLHWADSCSLHLLFTMLTDVNQTGLVVVGTCPDDIEESALANRMRKIQCLSKVHIQKISLGKLNDEEIGCMLSTSLGYPSPQDCETLTRVVSQQTKGSLLFITEFVRHLQESDVLYYEDGRWIYDEVEIQQAIKPCGLEAFFEQKLLKELSPKTREVLQVAASCGSIVNEQLIEYVLGHSVARNLRDAAAAGVLVGERDCYTFAHAEVQEAIYRLIPEEDRELFHVEVGRRLWRKLSGEQLGRRIFVLLTQFNLGKRLITRSKERVAVSHLCLHAGQIAATASAFHTAALHLDLGLELLGERGWRDEYDLSLSLHNAAAEMAMCTTNFERMDSLVNEILRHARCETDKVQGHATRLYMLGTSDRQHEAIDLGIKVLESLGERFPTRLCKAHLMREMKSVNKLLKNKTDDQLLGLPNMEDKTKIACMRILQLMYIHSLMARPGFAPFLTLKSLQLTLRYGLSALSAPFFGAFGMMLVTFKADFEKGTRFGKLSLRLLEKFHTVEYLPRVHAAYYVVIRPWRHPVRESLRPLQKGHRVGLTTGDFEFSAICAKSYCVYAMTCGVPLQQIDNEWKSFKETMLATGQQGALKMTLPYAQAMRHFMGLSNDPLASKGKLLDYDEALKDALTRGLVTLAFSLRVCRLMIAYVFCDYDMASELSCAILQTSLPFKIPPSFDWILGFFFTAMTALVSAERGEQRRKNIRTGRRIAKMFKDWATQSPYNFSDKQFLIEAELHSVKGEQKKAVKKYVCAIALSRESGFVFHQAIANERTARHFQRHGDMAAAEPYFLAACASYAEWGGVAKYKKLLEEVERLYGAK